MYSREARIMIIMWLKGTAFTIRNGSLLYSGGKMNGESTEKGMRHKYYRGRRGNRNAIRSRRFNGEQKGVSNRI